MTLAVITCLFNAADNAKRLDNLVRFRAGLGSAAEFLHIAECIVGDGPSRLQSLPNVHVFRTRSVLWQKERLLNLMIERLADMHDAVAWVDADIVFERDSWWREVLAALEDSDVLQPFSEVIDVPVLPGETPVESFCSRVTAAPARARERFHAHGHTGYGWAARSAVLCRSGLLDTCVLGGADHVMAHGFLGHLDVPCLPPLLDDGGPLFASYVDWVRRAGFDLRPLRLGCVTGRILHMRHGSAEGRQYIRRNRLLKESGYDPARHLHRNTCGCWEWTPDATRQDRMAQAYFAGRALDDAAA